MLRKNFFSVLAFLGAVIGLLVVFWSQRKEPVPPLPYPPPTSPYSSAIYAAGMIEASTENIAIGTPFLLPVVEIYVVEGDFVHAGDPLLKLDTRQFEAQKATAQAELKSSIINCENATKQFSFYERLKDKSAVSEQSYYSAYYAMKEAKELVDVAQTQLDQVVTDLKRSTIRAPVSGEILQVNVHVGEIYPMMSYNTTQSYSNLQTSLILMGTVAPMQMRVDIDEEDAWRFKKGSPATAFVRGNASIHFPMNFVRVEPYILPKTSFTGSTIERIDTRVLQVLYQFEKGELPVYAGQLLDVYIDASEELVKKKRKASQ
jgi:RND family efflux transporter MFP subunit